MNIIYTFTLRNLKQNRTRTLLTLLGIVLAVTLITGVMACFDSFDQYMIRFARDSFGDYHALVTKIEPEGLDKILQDQRLSSVTVLKDQGAALLQRGGADDSILAPGETVTSVFTQTSPEEDSGEQDMPMILDQFIGLKTEAMPPLVEIVVGTFPKAADEILLPANNLSWLGGNRVYRPGENFSVAMGKVISETTSTDEGTVVTNTFYAEETKNYKVVGLYKEKINYTTLMSEITSSLASSSLSNSSDSLSDSNFIYYSPVLMLPNSSDSSASLLIKAKDPNQIFAIMAEYENYTSNTVQFNSSLLMIEGDISIRTPGITEDAVSDLGSSISIKLMQNLMTIFVLALVMIGSISLIHNAFAISISQRTRELGLLGSVGADNRKILKSLLFEGLSLCLIGIPLGLLAGLGLGYLAVSLIVPWLHIQSPGSGDLLQLYLSPKSLGIALGLSLATVFISAYIPAARMIRLSILDALRQNRDIKLEHKSACAGKLLGRLFGFAGLSAARNYKRNRKQYRATVISLFMCLVLFLSAQSIMGYISYFSQYETNLGGYDTMGMIYPLYENKPLDIDAFIAETKKIPEVSQVTAMFALPLFYSVPEQDIAPEFLDYVSDYSLMAAKKPDGSLQMEGRLVFLDDKSFQRLKELSGGVSGKLGDAEVLIDDQVQFNREDFGYIRSAILKSSAGLIVDGVEPFGLLENQLPLGQQAEPVVESETGSEATGTPVSAETDEAVSDTAGAQKILYDPVLDDSEVEPLQPLLSSQLIRQNPSISSAYRSLLFSSLQSKMLLFVPYSAAPTLVGYNAEELANSQDPYLSFDTDGSEAATKGIYGAFLAVGRNGDVYNAYNDIQYAVAAAKILDILSTGFAIMIALIAAANIFSTITTNMSLRQREFAIFQSVGMGRKMLHRIQYLECALYAFKAFVYALPVVLLLNYFLTKIFQYRQANLGLLFPWRGLLICVISLAIVMLTAILYSRRQLRSDSFIETIRRDSI